MRHARRELRLGRTAEHSQATLDNLARNLLLHGRIRTTVAKAKVSRRVVDRLITLGKDGSVHARRQAYRVLQDRGLVKQLFADIAPRFLDCRGGYTRVLKLDGARHGDGAQTAILELTRLPAPPKGGPAPRKAKPAEPARPAPEQPKPKGFLEGLRGLFGKKKESGSSFTG
jgi:large subunit ribosomal protein L17